MLNDETAIILHYVTMAHSLTLYNHRRSPLSFDDDRRCRNN